MGDVGPTGGVLPLDPQQRALLARVVVSGLEFLRLDYALEGYPVLVSLAEHQ